MKILVLANSFPFPARNGRELPLAKIFEAIGRYHEVDFLVLSHDKEDFMKRKENLPSHLGEAYWLRPIPRSKIKRIIDELIGRRPAFFSEDYLEQELKEVLWNKTYDFVWVSPPGSYTLLEACTKYGIGTFKHTFLGLNDLITPHYAERITEITRRGIFNWWYLLFWVRSFFIARIERKYLQYFDLVHVQTPREKQKAIQLLGNSNFANRIIDSPNGVKTDLFDCQYLVEDRKAILFMTHLDGERKAEAEWFVQKVWPKVRAETDAELWLVGTPPKAAIPIIDEDPRIKVLGYVDSLAKTFEKVRLAVVPIFHSCGLINRIQDAMAAGVPVVSTAIAASTFPELEDHKHLLTSDHPKSFAVKTIKLYHDEHLRRALSTKGRAFIKTLPDWETTAARLLDAMEAIAKEQNFKAINKQHSSSPKLQEKTLGSTMN